MNIFSYFNIFKKSNNVLKTASQKPKKHYKNLEPLEKDEFKQIKKEKNSKSKEQIELGEIILKDEELNQNKEALKLAQQLLSRADNDAKIDFFKYLYKEKMFFEYSKDKFKYTNPLDKTIIYLDEDYISDYAKKIIALDKFSHNNYLANFLASSISMINSQEKAQGIYELTSAIFNEETQNRKNLVLDEPYYLNFLMRTVLLTENLEESKAKQLFLSKILKCDELANVSYFANTLGSLLASCKTRKQAEAKIEFIDKVLNSDKYNSGNIANLQNFLLLAGVVEDIKEVELAFLIEQNEKIFNNVKPTLLDCMDELVCGSDFENQAEIKLEILKLIINDMDCDKNKASIDKIIIKLRLLKSERSGERLREVLDDKTLTSRQKLIAIANGLEKNEIKKINKLYNADKINELSDDEIVLACSFADVFKVQNLDELSTSSKRDFLRKITASNDKCFESLDEIKKDFPLLPLTQEEYCKLLSGIIESLGINVEPLNEAQNKQVFNSINDLGKILKEISDKEFNNLKINLDSKSEVTSNNIKIEKTLKILFEFLPELKKQVNKTQHITHNFDLFKHSLKVMQKIVQNPDFENLNDHDKKTLLLASLFHDIAKEENAIDKKHPINSAFDTFFITKRLKLERSEQTKLYSLIKNHEWLAFVNNSKISNTKKIKRQQECAFDMQYDNLFKLSEIFTKADLKAVKSDNAFYEKYENDLISQTKTIQNLINELKTSQPLLPVTKIPQADKINAEIKCVNQDGSTNLKGIYKDKDGLIIIKFNELDNEILEKIGFEKDSMTKGIKSKDRDGNPIDTGNIKFFVHGLDYPVQLAKFDAFSLPDSDALLSVSYAERPESKFRFFRPQGIILDCETKYIHGGGETDAGSGCGKDIQTFKDNYIFKGQREQDRLFVSDLIKKTLGLNDSQYVDFVKNNENKSFNEIEPAFAREKLIKAFAGINSSKRLGEREYNEMYITNPKPPMAVFAYETNLNKKIANPVEFLNNDVVDFESGINLSVKKRTAFLREYALLHNIPFVVFGD